MTRNARRRDLALRIRPTMTRLAIIDTRNQQIRRLLRFARSVTILALHRDMLGMRELRIRVPHSRNTHWRNLPGIANGARRRNLVTRRARAAGEQTFGHLQRAIARPRQRFLLLLLR